MAAWRVAGRQQDLLARLSEWSLLSPCTEIPDNWPEGHFVAQIPDKDADLHSNPGQN
jgi:hypothetical protein